MRTKKESIGQNEGRFFLGGALGVRPPRWARGFRPFVHLALIFAQWWAPISAHASLGILGGLGNEGDSERTFEILERRLQKYLEDSPVRRLRVASVVGNESEQGTQLSLEQLQLQQISGEVISSFLKSQGPPPSDESMTKLLRLVEKLEGVATFGPDLQSAYVALAIAALNRGARSDAAVFLTRAKHFHPEGKLQARFPWDWGVSQESRGPERQRIEQTVEALWSGLPQPTLSCVLSWSPADAALPVLANGFLVSGTSVSVVPGTVVYLSQSLPNGTEVLSLYTQCRTAGTQWVKWKADPPALAWGWSEARKALLARISERQRLATLLVLDRVSKESRARFAVGGAREGAVERGEEFQIYVFTPGVGMDKVPLERPMREEEIRRGSTLPIRWSAFDGLLQKHLFERTPGSSDPFRPAVSPHSVDAGLLARANPLTGEVATDAYSSAPLSRASVSHTPVSYVPWYQRKETWIITGVLAAGIAVAFFASRSEAPVQNNAGFAIRLD